MKYRKKPVEIEAIPIIDVINAAEKNWAALPRWVRDAYEAGKLLFTDEAVEIVTLEGRMRGGYDSMLVQGIQGELYPCRMDIFVQTFEGAS